MFLLEDPGELDVILIDDAWSEPTADKAQIRMINLSPDAGTVSLKIDEVEDLFFEGLVFKTNSECESLDTKTYNLTVISTIGETFTSATNIELKGHRVYTLLLRGYEQATDNAKKLDLQLLTNYINY
jgi:hypothetical protein